MNDRMVLNNLSQRAVDGDEPFQTGDVRCLLEIILGLCSPEIAVHTLDEIRSACSVYQEWLAQERQGLISQIERIKQTIHVEADIPDGWYAVGFRQPKQNEYFISADLGGIMRCVMSTGMGPRLIIKEMT